MQVKNEITDRMLTTALFELILIASRFELSDTENEEKCLEDLVVESKSYAKLVSKFHMQEYR